MIEFNDKTYTKEDLKNILINLGLKKGDKLVVSSELFKLGKIIGDKNTFLDEIISTFYEILGSDGDLIMPTFTYSFCKNLVYDNLNSKSTVGALGEYFRHKSGVIRTDDPIFSFAIRSNNPEIYLKDCDSCFGKGSVYDVLREKDGKFLAFGDASKGWTFYLYAEEMAGVSYRFFKDFSGKIIDRKGVEREKTIKYYVRHLDRNSILDKQKQIDMLKKNKNYNYAKFAGGDMALIDLRQYFEIFVKTVKMDENILLKEEGERI